MARSGSRISPTRTIAPPPPRTSGWIPSPTAASIAAPSPDVSCVCGRRDGQAEHVGGQLDRGRTLRAAAGHPQLTVSGTPVALRGPLDALAQRVGEPLEDRAVEVGAGVDVAEADDRALRLRARDADAGRPVRLEDEAHRARRRRGEQLVEQRLRTSTPARAARATSRCPNSRLNHSTIQ